MYSHTTCATDTQNVKFVFDAVTDIIKRIWKTVGSSNQSFFLPLLLMYIFQHIKGAVCLVLIDINLYN